MVESDWATPVRWLKNGGLAVTVTTTLDGNDIFVTAERTVTFAIKDGREVGREFLTSHQEATGVTRRLGAKRSF